jgi:hypothetical protein
MKLIKTFNDWTRLNEELENQEIFTDAEIAALNAENDNPKSFAPAAPGTGGTYKTKPFVPASYKTTGKIVSKDLGAALFANAVDKINIDSDLFKDAVQLIKSLIVKDKSSSPKTNQVQTQMPLSANTYSFQESSQSAINEAVKTVIIGVVGGASAVGSANGYNNAALADRRRNNFIAAVKTALGPDAQYVTFTPGKSIVGTATVKNSAAAKAEQKVQITYPEYVKTTVPTNMQLPQDNTGSLVRPLDIDFDKMNKPKPNWLP